MPEQIDGQKLEISTLQSTSEKVPIQGANQIPEQINGEKLVISTLQTTSESQKVTIQGANQIPEQINGENLVISTLQTTSESQKVPIQGANQMHEQIDEFYKRYDTVKDTDWHKCRKHSRSTVMRLLVIGSEMIRTKGVLAADFRIETLKYPCHFQIAGSFKDLREPLRNMRNKYKEEQDHTAFNIFLKEAQCMYETFKKELCDND